MAKTQTTLNFAQALKRLEDILEKLESPDLDLEEGLRLLEEGVKLHKLCKEKLTEANVKITKILKNDSNQFYFKGVINIANKKIGAVTHYYDKIQVAVVKLTKGDLKVGDKVEFLDKSGSPFTQTVSSMQIEHANIDLVKSGDEFGIKVQKVTKAGSPVANVA